MEESKILSFLSMLSSELKYEEAKIYNLLLKNENQSALLISRSTGIKRTQVYRSLETLEKYNLVRIEKLSYGSLFSTTGLEKLEELVAKKETELSKLRASLKDIEIELINLEESNKGLSLKKESFQDTDALLEKLRSLSSQHDECKILATDNISEVCRSIEGDNVLCLTNSSGLSISDKTILRYVSPEVYKIEITILIYGDEDIMIITPNDSSLTATAVNSSVLAKMLAAMFDAIWRSAMPMPSKEL